MSFLKLADRSITTQISKFFLPSIPACYFLQLC
jgi:hypothetical protein